MEYIAAGWCTRKLVRLDQTMRNLTCSDLGIPLDSNGSNHFEKEEDGVIYLLCHIARLSYS